MLILFIIIYLFIISCVLTAERPTVTIDHEDVTVSVGSSVTITCRATGVPTPVITWTTSTYQPLPSHHQVGVCASNAMVTSEHLKQKQS